MSRQNEQWVWDHSPFTGGALLLHLAMADLANHENHDELWASDTYLATKARISEGSLRRYRSDMVTKGYLEIVEAGGGRGKRVRVRLLKPAQSEQVSSGKPAQDEQVSGAKRAQPESETRANATTNPRKCREVTSYQPNGTQESTQLPVEELLCRQLSEAIGSYLEDPKKAPPITKRWLTDMRLLVERGPLHRNKPEAIAPERVTHAIEFVFGHMADPGRDGFCWAAQIRSPGALRDHWDQLLDAARRLQRAATNGNGRRQDARNNSFLLGKVADSYATQ